MSIFHIYRQKGQIAPFLIAIIVILITAIMVTVNLGKVAMTRTNTANAADAGALAAASTMANGLNAICDIADEMLADYISTAATLATCPRCAIAYAVYGAHIASNSALFAYAMITAGDTLDQSEVAGRQLAFSNAGIDETKPRGGMNYEDWLKSDSNFNTWMDNEEYEDEDTYVWYDSDTKYGQGSRPLSARRNEVSVDVDPPSWSVIPFVGAIWFSGDCTLGCCDCCPCAPLPDPFITIAFVAGDTDDVRVSVVRREPPINLGLWRMRYPDSSGNIRSRGWAHAYGGRIYPPHFSDGDYYDSELTGAD